MHAPAYRPVELRCETIPTPIGAATAVVDDAGYLRAFDWSDQPLRLRRLLARFYGAVPIVSGAVPDAMRSAFAAYFDGALTALSGIAWQSAGTPFQQSVWQALTGIPAGTTLSYAGLAARIGNPAAIRAVGLANGANPVGLVVPCHRVIGSDGSMTGYGAGIERKRWLLRHEGALVEAPGLFS